MGIAQLRASLDLTTHNIKDLGRSLPKDWPLSIFEPPLHPLSLTVAILVTTLPQFGLIACDMSTELPGLSDDKRPPVHDQNPTEAVFLFECKVHFEF